MKRYSDSQSEATEESLVYGEGMHPMKHSTIAKLKKSSVIRDSDMIGGKLTTEAAKELYKKNIRVHHIHYIPKDKKKYFHELEIQGGRLSAVKAFKKLGSTVKHGINTATQEIQDIGEKGLELGEKVVEKTGDYIDTVIHGRGDYPPKVRELISKYGDKFIKGITIDRTPVEKVLKSALNVISKGAFLKRLNRTPYDEIFHLRIDITFDDGSRLAVEKNEVINMYTNPIKKQGGEQKQIEFIPQGISLNKLLEGGRKIQGSKWFNYSAFNNNCQDFILAILKGSGIGNEQDYNFVKQDTSSLFKGDSFLRKFSNTVTKIGAKANEITEGTGMSYKNKSSIKSKGMKKKIFGSDTSSDSSSDSDSDDGMHGSGLGEEKDIIKKMKTLEKDIKQHHKIHGGKIKVLKSFKNLGKTVVGGFESATGREFKSPEELREDFMINDARKAGNKISSTGKKFGNKTSDYVTSKRGGLASDLVKYGIPAATGAAFGALGTVAGLNPVGGVAATALGSKLGAVAADQITKKTGVGIHIDIASHNAKRDIEGGRLRGRKGPRPTKSSIEQLLEAHEKKQEKELKKNMLKMSKGVTKDVRAIKAHIGAGIGRGRPAKGSAEAKAWGLKMAEARAKRRTI